MRKMRQKERRKERRKEMEKQHDEQLFQLLNPPMPEITLTEKDTESTEKKVAAKEVEIKYVEICVICRRKGHSIPTCPELIDKSKRSTEETQTKKKKMMPRQKKKKSGNKLPECPQPLKDVEMKNGKEEKLLGCPPGNTFRKDETTGGKEDESIVNNGQEEKLLGCPPEDTLMKDEISDDKEDESIVKKGEEKKLLGCPPEDALMKDETSGGKEEESIVKKGEEEKLLGCPPEDTLKQDEISDDKEDESIVKIDSASHPEERSHVKPMIEQGPEIVNTVA